MIERDPIPTRMPPGTLYLVAWLSVSYTCPWGLGWLREPVKSLICSQSQALKWELTSYRSEAEKRIRQEGHGATLIFLELNGARAKPKKVAWPARLEIEP